jgi:hypothetical protein
MATETPPPVATPTVNPTRCPINLTCLRKLDSAQRHCYPFEANRQFECDGVRAQPSAPPASPTPDPQATRGGGGGDGDAQAQFVTFVVSGTTAEVATLTVTATAPATKGSFDASTCDTDEAAVSASGTTPLTVTLTPGQGDQTVTLPVEITCEFLLSGASTLVMSDVGVTVSPTGLTVTREVEVP